MQELVRDERTEILNSKSCLVRGELYFQAATVNHLPVKLFLGLLGVLSVVHLDESKVFLWVVEHVGELSELAEVLLQTLLGRAGVDVANVQAGPSAEFSLRTVDRWQFMGRTLNFLQSSQSWIAPSGPE